MATEALSRLKREGWIQTKFVEFVQKIYPEIDVAIEETTSEKLTLFFLTEKTLEIVTSPLQSSATLNVSIETIPLKEIREIKTEYNTYDADPSDDVNLSTLRFKAIIIFGNRQDLVIDLNNILSGPRYKIADLTSLLDQLRKTI